MTDSQTNSYYEKYADRLAESYSLGEASAPNSFASSSRVLDVGCGTGRDLLSLLQQGIKAEGCDTSTAMLDQARKTITDAGFESEQRLAEASLPELAPYSEENFDGILCSAVLMHLPREQHFDAACRFYALLKPGGRLILSFPSQRPGIDPQSDRDADGRLFTPIDPDEIQLLFERVGFDLQSRHQNPDSLGRPDHHWWTLCFTRLGKGAERPLQQVEHILNRDKKSSTYKLALFRALSELAQTRPHLGHFQRDGSVLVPVADVAEKWILYYWPLFDDPHYYPQQNGEKPSCAKPTAVRTALTPLIETFQPQGGFQAFASALDHGAFDAQAQKLLTQARKKVCSTVWNMPVRYAGGGKDFSVLQYDKPHMAIRMEAALWRELCLTGSWIADATLLRWAELTHRLSGEALSVSQVIERLLIVPDPKRRVQEARAIYANIPQLNCVWTDTRLRQGFEVDHAIPFTLWRNNALWNLFPATRQANNNKRGQLPTQRLLRKRKDALIHCWETLHEGFSDRFEREAQRLMEVETFPTQNWEASLFSSFAEAVETTAHLRGSPRWEPFRTPETSAPASSDIRKKPTTPHSAGQADNQQPTTLIPFVNSLPLVGSLAAGYPFHGFQTESLDILDGLDWLPIPEHLCKPRRFVVQVAGDSMEPTLPQGSHAIFEYHRRPRENGQIVIANLDELGSHHGTETIKRLHITPTHYRFQPDNPEHDAFEIEIEMTDYPILGIFVDKL